MAYPVILGDPSPFLDQVFSALTLAGIKVESFELDHICYRVAEGARYDLIKDELLKSGSLLSEKEIAGRAIAVIKLTTPIIYHDRQIGYVELPQPKPGSPYPEGYEHVEFVIDESLHSFMARYPDAPFDSNGLRKRINADVRLKYDGFSVKFHEQSLAYVIKYLE
jgi:predicted metalloenzyme YecM